MESTKEDEFIFNLLIDNKIFRADDKFTLSESFNKILNVNIPKWGTALAIERTILDTAPHLQEEELILIRHAVTSELTKDNTELAKDIEEVLSKHHQIAKTKKHNFKDCDQLVNHLMVVNPYS